jgi:DNA repair exonuclease SbcCD nuclease subunit
MALRMLLAHLSDLHLGRRFLWDPSGAERLATLRRALSKLAELHPAAILIAGDLFDSPQADEGLVREAAKALNRGAQGNGQPIVIVVIPGNHDPSDATTLWNSFTKVLGLDSPVRVALVPEAIELPKYETVIEAYPCESRYNPDPPWQRRLEVGSDCLRVVLAHGTLQGGPVPEGESDAYPFTPLDLEGLQADYVALGHFHGVYPPWPGGGEIERSYSYSGTPEPDDFSADSGKALLVEIEKGEAPRVRRVDVGRRQWRSLVITPTTGLRRIEELLQQIESSEDPAGFVIRLKVANNTRLAAPEVEKLNQFEGSLRALGAQLERRGDLQAQVDVQSLDMGALPSGAVTETLKELQAELAGTADLEYDRIAAALQMGWEKLKEMA